VKDRPFTIGELARLTGASIETIRYYERIGLMPRPPRTGGGRRAYGPESLATLNFIRRCRELGFSLNDVRELVAQRHAQPCCARVKAIATRHLETVRSKLRDLSEMEASLASLVARCSGEPTGDCAALDALDAGAVGELGATV
jgi:MerR family transcriptional regulator, mercuric resistance operon regulatory protein